MKRMDPYDDEYGEYDPEYDPVDLMDQPGECSIWKKVLVLVQLHNHMVEITNHGYCHLQS